MKTIEFSQYEFHIVHIVKLTLVVNEVQAKTNRKLLEMLLTNISQELRSNFPNPRLVSRVFYLTLSMSIMEVDVLLPCIFCICLETFHGR